MRSMPATMRSVTDFIDKLGGSTAVAAVLNVPATTVASWKSRKSIPVEHWAQLLGIARERGHADWDYAALVGLHTSSEPVKAAS